MLDLYKYENELKDKGYKIIAGTDEVGRGPMAGPVVVASVVLDDNNFIEGLNDSKKLTPKKRKELSEIIKAKALDYSITFIPVEEVDRINVLEASRKGMMECIRKLKVKVDYVLSDAVKLDFEFPCLNIIKGDSKSASISAASIVAKVARDEYMDELDKDFPMYGFKKHKGYVTKYHLNAIDKYGVCIHHRKSFAPVQKIIERDKKTLV